MRRLIVFPSWSSNMNKSHSPLMPCPFCGSRDIRILPQSGGWMSVNCQECNATKREVTRYTEQMVAAWNMRLQPEARIAITVKEVVDKITSPLTFPGDKVAWWVFITSGGAIDGAKAKAILACLNTMTELAVSGVQLDFQTHSAAELIGKYELVL